MNVAKLLIFIICVFFLIIAPVGSEIRGEEFSFGGGINTAAAMNAFRSDTVMLSSGDFTITWSELYISLHDIAAQLSNGFQENPQWDQLYYSDATLAEAVKSFVIDQCIQTLVLKYGANTLNLTAGEGMPEDIQSIIDTQILEAGGIKELENNLRGHGFVNLDVYTNWLKQRSLHERIITELYGESQTEISDEAVADFAQREGFMRAKHILLVFPSEQGGFSPEEIEDAKADAHEKLAGILGELNKRKNDADFFDFFDTLMIEHSEDPGSTSSPDGYLFQFYDMVEPFSSAAEALQPGDLSGIVETSYGYHVILRLPLDFDMVPISLMSSGESYSLRQLALFDDFDSVYFEWYNSMQIEHSSALDALDVSELFAWHE